ncbi:MAG: hypothetical protein ABIG84_00425 [archaeon]
MVMAKITLDDKHVCSAHMKGEALHLSVSNYSKLLVSPRFVKLALSLKAATRDAEGTEKGLDVKFDAGFIKGIFSR